MRLKALSKTICMIMLSLCLFGCGQKQKENVTLESGAKDTVEENPIFSMTMEEVYALTSEETEKLITEHVKNWRQVYAIDNDHEMSKDDWLAVKGLLGYQLWGREYLEFEKKQAKNTIPVTNTEVHIEEATADYELPEEYKTDPDLIYEIPTREYILSLSDEEFIEYMDKMSEHWGYSAIGVDSPFSLLSKEDLDEVRQELLSICGTDIPTPEKIRTEDPPEEETGEVINVEQVTPE